MAGLKKKKRTIKLRNKNKLKKKTYRQCVLIFFRTEKISDVVIIIPAVLKANESST